MTEADIKAMVTALWCAEERPLTEEELAAAKVAFGKMSDWQTLGYDELAQIIKREEEARAQQSGDNSR